MRDLDAVRRGFLEPVAAVWIESPTNPLMNLIDLAAVAAISREFGAISICNNTFASPYFQPPLDLGIDISMHSTTNTSKAIPTFWVAR